MEQKKLLILEIPEGQDKPYSFNGAFYLFDQKKIRHATINEIKDMILNNQTITNAMLKTIIDVIEVDDDANIEVRLKLLNEIGTNQPVITKFEDILTVTESNISTQRCK